MGLAEPRANPPRPHVHGSKLAHARDSSGVPRRARLMP
jgi:hypothetical protein